MLCILVGITLHARLEWVNSKVTGGAFEIMLFVRPTRGHSGRYRVNDSNLEP